MKRIVCFHLLNDYSGSPKVLKTILEWLLEKGWQIDLTTSKDGPLTQLKQSRQLRFHSYSYHFSDNPIVTLLRYSLVQIYTFFLAFKWLFSKNTVFYINTLLPLGPALAGRIMNKNVIYHYHENAFIKGRFYKILAYCMQRLANKIICVSNYQASFLNNKNKFIVIPNSLPPDFTKDFVHNPDIAFNNKTILMLSSLKEYKGTKQFIELSQQLPQYSFILVINDNQDNIDNYIKRNFQKLNKSNLKIYARQDSVTEFYRQSSVLLNLSDKHQIIETFGMTILEALSFGLPSIVPTEGGPAELITDGVNGFKTDVQHLDKIKQQIKLLLSNKEVYSTMSRNALDTATQFNTVNTMKRIETIFREQ